MLGTPWPAPADDPNQTRLQVTNLAAVWANYRSAGSRRLIIADAIESDVDLIGWQRWRAGSRQPTSRISASPVEVSLKRYPGQLCCPTPCRCR
jgi:hypothetical protein